MAKLASRPAWPMPPSSVAMAAGPTAKCCAPTGSDGVWLRTGDRAPTAPFRWCLLGRDVESGILQYPSLERPAWSGGTHSLPEAARRFSKGCMPVQASPPSATSAPEACLTAAPNSACHRCHPRTSFFCPVRGHRLTHRPSGRLSLRYQARAISAKMISGTRGKSRI